MFCYVSLISVTNFIVFACFIYNVRTETLSYYHNERPRVSKYIKDNVYSEKKDIREHLHFEF